MTTGLSFVVFSKYCVVSFAPSTVGVATLSVTSLSAKPANNSKCAGVSRIPTTRLFGFWIVIFRVEIVRLVVSGNAKIYMLLFVSTRKVLPEAWEVLIFVLLLSG